jgi:sarcosine oxidase subunit beta
VKLPPRGLPVPEKSDTVIIGAGVLGLSIAYNLTKLGVTDVCVIDKGYLAGGASGRNGGGVRQQWSTELNIRLMQESVELVKGFAHELGVNVWFRQGGYLFLARTAAETARLADKVKIQNQCGVQTRMLSPAEAQKIVPQLEISRLHSACFNPTDGIIFPWPFLWGYAERAVAKGAKLHLGTAVRAIDPVTDGGTGYVVRTDHGDCKARRVVNAAGAWSPELARMVGIELPNHPVKHEICSSEPLKPFLGPMVSMPATGLYFSQSMRGEIVGGITIRDHGSTLSMGSTLKFLAAYSRGLCELVPSLAELKILRQWAGPYDMTTDGNPIVGDTAARPGFFNCCGFLGYGFMMAPVIGKLYAAYLADPKDRHQIFDRWKLERFADPDRAGEREDFVIG